VILRQDRGAKVEAAARQEHDLCPFHGHGPSCLVTRAGRHSPR
jgi:hypothetical protein